MPRRYAKRQNWYPKKNKYSSEHKGFDISIPSVEVNGLRQTSITIIPSTNIQGMRKVKHLTVSLSERNSESAEYYWALVYVPEGQDPTPLFSQTGSPTNGSLYEPNQFVMASGWSDPSAGPVRVRSPISRNLNSGDSVHLVVGTFPTTGSTPSYNLAGIISYAITLQ